MSPISLPELRQVMQDIIATNHRPGAGQGSINAPQVQGLERGVELIDTILGPTGQQGLKAA